MRQHAKRAGRRTSTTMLAEATCGASVPATEFRSIFGIRNLTKI